MIYFSKELLLSKYPSGTVLINGGSGLLIIKFSGWFKIECVGGGGGAAVSDAYSGGGNNYARAGGGSGAAWVGEVYLKAGSYNYSTGNGGNGSRVQYGDVYSSAGGSSYIQNVISCGGGGGAHANWSSVATGGDGGSSPSISASKTKNVTVNIGGASGNGIVNFMPDPAASGGSSRYGNVGSGGTGYATSAENGGNGLLIVTAL